jgi:hypothetical protein
MARSAGWRAIAVLGACASAFSGAQAQDPDAFYKGRTIDMIVGSEAGSGYDAYARLVAAHLGKQIPGRPNILVKQMIGAGGIVATNYIYNLGTKDGLTIGGVQNNTPFEPLLGTKEAEYDPKKFNYLGSPSYETGLLIVWHTSPVSNVEDARKKEFTVSSSGANSTPGFFARLLNELLGMKLKIVLGYPGQNESFIAMERGEVDGYPSIFWSSLASTRPDWMVSTPHWATTTTRKSQHWCRRPQPRCRYPRVRCCAGSGSGRYPGWPYAGPSSLRHIGIRCRSCVHSTTSFTPRCASSMPERSVRISTSPQPRRMS